MAIAESILIQNILQLLVKEPEGLEVEELVELLGAKNGAISARGVRNLINRLAKEGKLIKRKRQGQGRGAPPYAYYHPETVLRNLNIFDHIPGVSNKSRFISRTEIEEALLDPGERERQIRARSVLEQIAATHSSSKAYAKAIIDIAPQLAAENPVELVVRMARWVTEDINHLGSELERKWKLGKVNEVKKLSAKLEERLRWASAYFQQFWRLDRSLDQIQGILDLPEQPKHFLQEGRRARLNEEEARKRLQKRILGDRLIEERVLPTDLHKTAIGTDASVAEIFLAHSNGSFIPPDPVVVTASAAAMVVSAANALELEYQDFDILPDRFSEYEDYNTAVNGLVLSPKLMQSIGRDEFKRSQIAAMDLRQYSQDFQIAIRGARWQPVGEAPELGIEPRATLILRDGRVFPVVHRLNVYETDGLYGQIVRNSIEKFVDVIHNTLSSPSGEIIYGATVKNPEFSWLAPLVFWYLHTNQVSFGGKVVIEAEDIYKYPLADTAVSHLLFLGIAKQSGNFAQDRLCVTCRVLRRFSDIAFVDTSLPVSISKGEQIRLLDENVLEDWAKFVDERIARKKETHQESILDRGDYTSFIYACSKVGVLMCYAAPTSAYKPIVAHDLAGAGHFLIPRLEVAINLVPSYKLDSYHKSVDGILSWLASGHWEFDRAHTQSGFDTNDSQHTLPILVPDITLLANQAAKFARNKLSQEVEDKIRELIANLRKVMAKGH